MEQLLLQRIADGLAEMSVPVPEGAIEQLGRYCDLLLEKNQVMNLTAITEPADVAVYHFLDCAAILQGRDLRGKRMIDVGTGAGFPGVVLKILCPELRLTLMDTLGKRVDWLRELCDTLGLEHVECVKARAEELSHTAGQRDSYDFAVSRAVAAMPMLAELCLPFVRPGGQFIAMKSSGSDEELAAAAQIMKTLSAGNPEKTDYILPGTEVSHRLVILPKQGKTPKGYPRKWSKIKGTKN